VRFRQTVGEILWPNAQEFVASLGGDRHAASIQILDLVWKGYDLMAAELAHVDLAKPLDDLERSLTELLERRIRRVMTGFETFEIQHGAYERETRRPAPAQPPQYDLAFVLGANERIMWPFEAKVLPKAIADYIADVQNEFFTCRYGPFSAEGSMLGYVLSGDVEILFKLFSERIPAVLRAHPAFATRPHQFSDHRRPVSPTKPYPVEFRLHHLLLTLGQS
jgi:hypothetical protein